MKRKSKLYWQTKIQLDRWRRALAYGAGRLTDRQALDVIFDCEPFARCYGLVHLSETDALDDALDRFEDHPKLADFIAEGCQHVASKWEDYNETAFYAKDWAINKAAEYAAMEGVEFREREEEE